jgi:hypothetical protein
MRVMAVIPAFAFGVGMPAWRCELSAPPHDALLAAAEVAPYEESVRPRESMAPRPAPAKPATRVLIPEGAVIHALDLGQRAFLRCFQRAQRRDPSLASIKVTLHLEVDADGAVTLATSDADGELAACVANIGRRLSFPAPHAPAVVETPLMWHP